MIKPKGIGLLCEEARPMPFFETFETECMRRVCQFFRQALQALVVQALVVPALEENICIMFQNSLMAKKDRPPMSVSVTTTLGM